MHQKGSILGCKLTCRANDGDSVMKENNIKNKDNDLLFDIFDYQYINIIIFVRTFGNVDTEINIATAK